MVAWMLCGCAKQYEIVTGPQQAEVGHYILMQYTRAGGIKLWDCREKPDGERWDPTCGGPRRSCDPGAAQGHR